MGRILCIFAALLCLSTVASAEDDQTPVPIPAVLSIIPGQGSPGTTVVISGTGFTEKTAVFLGTNAVPAQLDDKRHLIFDIPVLAAGNYALYLQQPGANSSRAYAFNVVPVKPVAAALSPDSVSFCGTPQERTISVSGKNILPGAQVVFDGAIIRSARQSEEEITFITPPVPGGLHQVQIKNPEDTISGALGLLVATRPEIQGVRQGNDYVNYYDLNIEGINFQHGSALIVDGKRILSGQSLPGERDRLQFVSCNRLLYQRYPYDPSMKSLSLIVVNPSGEESAQFFVSAP